MEMKRECKFTVGNYYKDRDGFVEQVESIDISAGKIETSVASYYLNGRISHYGFNKGYDLIPSEVDQNGNTLLTLALEVGKKYVSANERVFEVIFERDGQYLATEINRDLSILIYNRAGTVDSLYPPSYNLVSEYQEPQVSYVNVYRNLVEVPHKTRELADAAAATQKDGDRIACIKITEGQFDE